MKPTIEAFRLALKARLEANTDILADSAANGDDLQICDGNPHPETASSSMIILGSASNHNLAYSCGMQKARETYDFMVIISLLGSAYNDKSALRDRAYGLFSLVQEDILLWDTEGFLNADDEKVVDIALPDFDEEEEIIGEGLMGFVIYMNISVNADLQRVTT